MSQFDRWIGNESEGKAASGIPGVVAAIVTNNEDPQKLGRVKVQFSCWGDAVESAWARLVTPMAGDGFGMYLLPDVDDEVLVGFAQGDPCCPYVLGMLWNGRNKPPETNEDGKNHRRLVRSRSGHSIAFNDEPGKASLEIVSSSGHIVRLTDERGREKIELVDKTGENSVVLDSVGKSIKMTAANSITLSAPKGTIKLESQQLALNASATVIVKAGGDLLVESSSITNIKGSMVNIN